MENKKTNKDIARGIIMDNILVNQSEKQLRQSLIDQGLNPDEVIKGYVEKVESLIKLAEEKKRIIKKRREMDGPGR